MKWPMQKRDLVHHMSVHFGWLSDDWLDVAFEAIELADTGRYRPEIEVPSGFMFRDDEGAERETMHVWEVIDLLDLSRFVTPPEALVELRRQQNEADEHWAKDRAAEGLRAPWADGPFIPMSEAGNAAHLRGECPGSRNLSAT